MPAAPSAWRWQSWSQGTNTLIVASSDLSHYHTYDEAVRDDHKTLKAIGEYDYFDLSRNLDLRIWEACGGGPIVAIMIAAERLGANQATVLHYANTGDVTGDHSRVVGYGAVALVKAAGAAKTDEAPFSLTKPEKDARCSRSLASRSKPRSARARLTSVPPADWRRSRRSAGRS